VDFKQTIASSIIALSKAEHAPVDACQGEFDEFTKTFSSLPEDIGEQFQATLNNISNQEDE